MSEFTHPQRTPEQIEQAIREHLGDLAFATDTFRVKDMLGTDLETLVRETKDIPTENQHITETVKEDTLVRSQYDVIDRPLRNGGSLKIFLGTEKKYALEGELSEAREPIEVFDGVKLVAKYDLDEKGEPTKEITYWRHYNDPFAQKTRSQLVTRDGILRSGDTPMASDTIYTELAVVLGDDLTVEQLEVVIKTLDY